MAYQHYLGEPQTRSQVLRFGGSTLLGESIFVFIISLTCIKKLVGTKKFRGSKNWGTLTPHARRGYGSVETYTGVLSIETVSWLNY